MSVTRDNWAGIVTTRTPLPAVLVSAFNTCARVGAKDRRRQEHLPRPETAGEPVLSGEFIVEFRLLETLIKDAISFFLNPIDSTPGRIVTGGVPFLQLLNILIALFHHETRDDEETETLRIVLEECGKTNKQRNQLVHSFWYTEDRENTRIDILVKSLKPYREDHEQNVPGETLETNTRQCRERRERFEALMEKSFPKMGSPRDAV